MDAQLTAFVKELVAASQSGKYDEQMGFVPGRKLCINARHKGGETYDEFCQGITAAQLRKLEGAKLISINSPRSSWTIKLRPAAFDAVK